MAANASSDAAGDWSDRADDWSATQRPTMPTGVLVSAHDVAIRRWAERDHHVVRWMELDSGGHFLAMEAPDLLVQYAMVA